MQPQKHDTATAKTHILRIRFMMFSFLKVMGYTRNPKFGAGCDLKLPNLMTLLLPKQMKTLTHRRLIISRPFGRLGLTIGESGYDNITHHGTFQSEWQVSGISEQGHFKNAKALEKWYGVDPFCHAEIIPHLPEKTAN